jgi:hypothetical protein
VTSAPQNCGRAIECGTVFDSSHLICLAENNGVHFNARRGRRRRAVWTSRSDADRAEEIIMASPEGVPSLQLQPLCPLARPGLAKRLALMAGAWALLGALIGFQTLPLAADVVRAISGVVAGVIILVPLGVFLGLAGGRPGPTLFGGAAGGALGIAASWLAGTGSSAPVVGVALLGGALAGATLHLVSAWLVFLVRTIHLLRRDRAGV